MPGRGLAPCPGYTNCYKQSIKIENIENMKSKCILWGCMALALILAGCNDDDDTGKVELKSITINPTSVSLTAGFTQQLTATTDPDLM
jgi:uncharacterized protein YjdB